MGWGGVVLVVALQVLFLSLPPNASAAAGRLAFPPILSPIFDGPCNIAQCGKGSCRVSPEHAFGYVCDCDPGWTKIHFGDQFQFLPCVIPNCTFDYSCTNSSLNAPPPVGLQPPSNPFMFNPCSWSYCGEGTCVKTSDFGHRCDCKPGYANLLNATIFPCFKECVYGADCENIGITMPHGSPPASTTSSTPPGNGATARFPRSWIWMFPWMVLLLMIPRT